ncbi:uncharacterized protein RCO7_14875 [Rhynchosporium graminicola]|uniref:Uncharacterized protein n=1 Tax=Rhynchosporium graminicola TaxID=2792576 RepID=A0A1E1L7N6_9HELO|nr:uncharacterized protein RCO7_14875 [Rhynchosporium commune]
MWLKTAPRPKYTRLAESAAMKMFAPRWTMQDSCIRAYGDASYESRMSTPRVMELDYAYQKKLVGTTVDNSEKVLIPNAGVFVLKGLRYTIECSDSRRELQRLHGMP